MKVITKYPVYINKERISHDSLYSALDGKSPKAEVQAFQDWLDVKHPGWVLGKNLNKGKGYGTFGPSTSSAWEKYSAEYTAFLAPASTTTTTSSTPKTGEPSDAQKEEAKKKGLTWDKAKGAWTKAKDAGVFDTIKDLFGKKDTSSSQAPVADVPSAPASEDKKMSKTTKYILIGAGVLTLGAIIYFATRKKSTAKA